MTVVDIAPGTTTWQVPAGVTVLDKLEIWGNGGNGGSNAAGGGGGGGGGYIQFLNVTVPANEVIDVEIAAGGTTGTDETQWDYINEVSSAPSSKAYGGANASGRTGGAGSGLGGESSGTPDINNPGGTGGTTPVRGTGGGGGGGAGGDEGAGQPGADVSSGTTGGTGGGGGTSDGTNPSTGGDGGNSTQAGGIGLTWGGGGGGGGAVSQAGGTGGAGHIRITYTPAATGKPTHMMNYARQRNK